MNSTRSPHSVPLDYLEKYALTRPPFENTADSEFFYGSTALMQRLDLLAHLTQFGDPLILVIGPPNSGKSTMLEQFVVRASNRWYLCQLTADSLEQLPAHFSSALGDTTLSTGIDALLDRWDSETDASRLFVIAIDDADNLDANACRTLCELLDRPQGERLRVLLFGTASMQPMLKESLTKLGSTRTLQVLDVPRLSEEETAAYLMYRLSVAGYSGESPFSTTEIRAICKAADGWPGAINELADQTLRDNMLRSEKRPVITQKHSRRPRWLAVPAVLAIAVIYLVWQNLYAPDQNQKTSAVMEETTLTLPPESEPQPELAATPERPLPHDSHASQQPATDVPSPDLVDARPATAAAMPLAEAPVALPAEEPQPSREEVPSVTPDSSITVLAEPLESPSSSAKEVQPPIPLEPPESPAETAPAPPAAETLQPVDAPTAKTAVPTRNAAWLMDQPASHFSLQLLGSRSEKAVTDFIRRHQLDPEQTAYYRGLHQDADWFVVMYGAFPSRDAAMEGLRSLPQAVRKAKPWPRKLEVVHQAIQAAAPEKAGIEQGN